MNECGEGEPNQQWSVNPGSKTTIIPLTPGYSCKEVHANEDVRYPTLYLNQNKNCFFLESPLQAIAQLVLVTCYPRVFPSLLTIFSISGITFPPSTSCHEGGIRIWWIVSERQFSHVVCCFCSTISCTLGRAVTIERRLFILACLCCAL